MSQNFRKFTKSAGFFLQVHILTKCCYSIALIDRINPSITPTQQPNFPYQNLAKKNLRNCDSRISFNELVSWVFSSDGPSEETQRIFRWRRRRLLLPHGWRYGQRALGVEMDLCWFRGFRSRKRTNSRFQDSKSNRMEVWLVENRTEFIRQNMGHSHHFYLAKLFQNIQLIFFRNLESNWSSNLYLKGGFVQQRSDPTRFWSAPFLGTEFVPFCWAGAKLSFDGSWSPFFRRLLGCTEFGCLDNFFEKKKQVEDYSLEVVSHIFFCSPAKQEMEKGDRLQWKIVEWASICCWQACNYVHNFVCDSINLSHHISLWIYSM